MSPATRPAPPRSELAPRTIGPLKAAAAEVAPRVGRRSVDEIDIDLRDLPSAQDAVAHDPIGGVRAIALDIRNQVQRATA